MTGLPPFLSASQSSSAPRREASRWSTGCWGQEEWGWAASPPAQWGSNWGDGWYGGGEWNVSGKGGSSNDWWVNQGYPPPPDWGKGYPIRGKGSWGSALNYNDIK
ncbi:hypothetical protein Pmar_PMAR011444, partial [Perkinsus marinus ATCC 50983]